MYYYGYDENDNLFFAKKVDKNMYKFDFKSLNFKTKIALNYRPMFHIGDDFIAAFKTFKDQCASEYNRELWASLGNKKQQAKETRQYRKLLKLLQDSQERLLKEKPELFL